MELYDIPVRVRVRNGWRPDINHENDTHLTNTNSGYAFRYRNVLMAEDTADEFHGVNASKMTI